MSVQPRRIVFAGAGHAHLHALSRASEYVRRGLEVVVVAPENFWYSGRATGMLGGRYDAAEDQIDLEALLRLAGPSVRLLRDRLVSIQPQARTVLLAGGGELPYDLLSLNLGSEVRALPGASRGVFPIKPLRHLWELRQALEAARTAGSKPRVVVVGGGASGCEIAANVRALLGAGAGEITLLCGSDRLVPDFSARAAQALARRLTEHGIDLKADSSVARLEEGVAITAAGERHPFDFLVNATGLQAPAVLAGSGLPLGGKGELLVDPFLRSTGDPRVFGGGDCIVMAGRRLAKNGVYAVRESPVLHHNLLATLAGDALRPYRPQRHCLLILNLGGDTGLAHRGGWHWLGRAAGWLKHLLDERYLARHRR